MQLSKHFKLEEFTKSMTATRKGIDNTPGAGDIKNLGEIDSSVNVDFSNVRGLDVNAKYNLDDGLLTGSAVQYKDVGNTGWKVGVGATYDGNLEPTFQIKRSFKRGGLLDKNRG